MLIHHPAKKTILVERKSFRCDMLNFVAQALLPVFVSTHAKSQIAQGGAGL